MSFTSLLKSTLLLILATAWLPKAFAEEAPGSSCEDQRNELRKRTLTFLGVTNPDIDLKNDQLMKEFVDERCNNNRGAPVNQKNGHACQNAYREIRDTIVKADDKANSACTTLENAKGIAASCSEGQSTCFRKASALFKSAAKDLGDAKKLVNKGSLQAQKLADQNKAVAMQYATHLKQISIAIRDLQNRAQNDPVLAGQIRSKMNSSGITFAEIAIQEKDLGKLQPELEGGRELKRVLDLAGVPGNDPEKIDARAMEIMAATQKTTPGAGSPASSEFGTLAGETIHAREAANRFVAAAPEIESRLGAGESTISHFANDMDRRAAGLAPTPPPAGGEIAAKPVSGGATRLDTPTVASGGSVRSGSSGDSLPSSMMASNEVFGSSTGASRPRSISGASAPQPSGKTGAAVAAVETSGTTPFNTSTTGVNPTAQSTAQAGSPTSPVAEKTVTASPDSQMPATFGEPYSLPSQDPAKHEGSYKGSVAASALRSGVVPSTAQTAAAKYQNGLAQEAIGKKALENPEVKNIVDKEVTRLTAGKSFSNDLREKLRRRLAASTSQKLAEARSAKEKQSGSTGAVADFLKDLKSNQQESDSAALESAFQMGSADTEAEVQRMVSSVNEPVSFDIPRSNSPSLFERVHSAHTRFLKKKNSAALADEMAGS